MEAKVDIREIAEYRKNEFEQKIKSSEYSSAYSIYYVVITEDGEVRVSKTPHILAGVEQCYLIHNWLHCPCSNWYNTYQVEGISVYGELGDGSFDDEYSFSISDERFNRCEEIRLMRDCQVIYSTCLRNYGTLVLGDKLREVWKLYQKCKKECTTQYESKLMGKLAEKAATIDELKEKLADSTLKEQYLQGEISKYKSLLDDMKSVLATI